MGWPFKKKSTPTEERSAYFSGQTPLVSYWNLFIEEHAAREAAEQLRAQSLLAGVQRSEGQKGSWLLLAYMPLPATEDIVEHYSRVVRDVVEPLGGEYDGWEAGPLPDEETVTRIQSWLEAGVGRA
jgi:hypothetical protein